MLLHCALQIYLPQKHNIFEGEYDILEVPHDPLNPVKFATNTLNLQDLLLEIFPSCPQGYNLTNDIFQLLDGCVWEGRICKTLNDMI